LVTKAGGIFSRTLRCLVVAAGTLLVVGCAATDWTPVNAPLAGQTETKPFFYAIPSSEEGLVIGLSFSGGGTRAAAFAYGVLDGLRSRVSSGGRPLLDNVKFLSGVSGGSVTAAYFGLFHERIFADFEQKFLYANAEADLRTTFGPGVITAALSGGVNDQTRLPRWFERELFGHATVKDLIESTPRVIVNATDVYNRVPFAFTAQTFNAICSDPASVLVADAIAASAAVPIAFVPIVMQVYKDRCKSPLPAWVRAAIDDPKAGAKIRATATAWERYRNDPEVNFLKLADGGIADNFGLSSLSLLLESVNGIQNLVDLTHVRHLVVLVVDAGQQQTGAWTRTPGGSSGIDLAVAAIDTGIDSSARTNFDLFDRLIRQWKQEAIASSCRSDIANFDRAGTSAPGRRCADVDVTVRRLSFDDLGPMRARELSKVSTRFVLPPDEVAAIIQAGRDVARIAHWERQKIIARPRL
jgi:predicted acylesterase/phospholipase RssA